MSQLVTSDNVTDTDQIRSLPEGSKPVQLPATLDISRKPKIVPTATTNGHTNGHPETSGTKRKRSLEDPEQNLKRSKTQVGFKTEATQSENVVIEDDEHNGAIVIDSD